MKKTVSLLLLTVALAAQLFACGTEPQEEAAPSYPLWTGDGDANLIKSELSDVSLSYIADLFVGALENEYGLAEALGAYSADASLAGGKKMTLDGGVVTYSDGGVLKFAAAYGTDGLKVVKPAADGSGYALSEGAALGSAKLTEAVSKIGATVRFAEEHFSLPKIQDGDIIRDGGAYYLGDEYVALLLENVLEASLCISAGASSPSELDAARLAQIKAEAQELARGIELRLGFGLRMKRISSVHVTFASDSTAAYTDGRFDKISFDACMELDSKREHVRTVGINWSSVGEESGSVKLSAELEALFDLNGSLISVGAELDAKLGGVLIGAEGEEQLVGFRTVKASVKFNPYSNEKSIELDYSDVRKREENSDKVYSEVGYAVTVGAIVKGQTSSVELSSISRAEGKSDIGFSVTGKANFGGVTSPVVLPDGVKSLLGLEKSE